MIKLIAKLKTSRSAYKLEIKEKLILPFAQRQLPKGEALRSGDLATSSQGDVYEIIAAPEKLLHIDCPAPKEAATLGYLLGSGHVPVQIGKGFLRIAHVPELEEALPQLGVNVSQVEAPFEPDFGASGHDHHHGHDHGHDHDHDHDHPH
jgi:urease accessory protein